MEQSTVTNEPVLDAWRIMFVNQSRTLDQKEAICLITLESAARVAALTKAWCHQLSMQFATILGCNHYSVLEIGCRGRLSAS